MTIKTFTCGLCKKDKHYVGTRKGLRDHIKKEHVIRSELTNQKHNSNNEQLIKQTWWITKETK